MIKISVESEDNEEIKTDNIFAVHRINDKEMATVLEGNFKDEEILMLMVVSLTNLMKAHLENMEEVFGEGDILSKIAYNVDSTLDLVTNIVGKNLMGEVVDKMVEKYTAGGKDIAEIMEMISKDNPNTEIVGINIKEMMKQLLNKEDSEDE